MRFSVIMPLYNKAPYVSKAIRSIIKQSFTDFELVIVDDGSTDDSAEIAEQTIEGNKNCRLIRQKNAGVSTARNNGVSVSNGDYLCFLDADDWWEPDFLERMDSFISEYPDAGLYGSNYLYVKNGKVRIGVHSAKTGYINYCRVYADNGFMPIWTGAASVPRSVFDEMGGFCPELALGEDFILWLSISCKYKVAFLETPLASYNQDADTKSRATSQLIPPMHHMLWHLDAFMDKEKADKDFKRLVDNLRTYGLRPYYLSRQYRNEAIRELDKVCWAEQPAKTRIWYKMPVPLLKAWTFLLRSGANVKKRMACPIS